VRYTHHQLAALSALKIDVLVHYAMIGILVASKLGRICIFLPNQRDRIDLVRRIAEKVEDCRIGGIARFKLNLGIAAPYIETIEVTYGIAFAIHANGSTSPDIKRSEFAPFKKILRFEHRIAGQ
jgi:hypothetical protein